jgi:hypothetical protein
MTELTEKNAEVGKLIVSKEHPEWGEFVLKEYNPRGWWNIRGLRGYKVLNIGEFKFWNMVEVEEHNPNSLLTDEDLIAFKKYVETNYKPWEISDTMRESYYAVEKEMIRRDLIKPVFYSE